MQNKKRNAVLAFMTGLVLAVSPAVVYAQETEALTELAGETEMETEAETEEVYEEEKLLYVLDDVYVRSEPDAKSEILAVAKRGQEIRVIGKIGGWYHIVLGEKKTDENADTDEKQADGVTKVDAPETDAEPAETETETELLSVSSKEEKDAVQTGYIAEKYVTDSKEEAQNAVEAQKSALKAQEQAAAAAAAAAQQAAASQQTGASADSGNTDRVEVSREKFDDCDGSGHGYYEITYSDGTTEIVEY